MAQRMDKTEIDCKTDQWRRQGKQRCQQHKLGEPGAPSAIDHPLDKAEDQRQRNNNSNDIKRLPDCLCRTTYKVTKNHLNRFTVHHADTDHHQLVVVGISMMHREPVEVIFGYLVGGPTQAVWQALDVIAVIVALALVFCLVQGVINRRWRAGLAELVLLATLFALTPPLVGFAVYFCLVHTLRHVRAILSSLGTGMSGLMLLSQVILFTLASWLAGGMAFWFLAETGDSESALMRVVFIGLAALTVPHMILVDGFFRRARRSLRRQFISRQSL